MHHDLYLTTVASAALGCTTAAALVRDQNLRDPQVECHHDVDGGCRAVGCTHTHVVVVMACQIALPRSGTGLPQTQVGVVVYACHDRRDRAVHGVAHPRICLRHPARRVYRHHAPPGDVPPCLASEPLAPPLELVAVRVAAGAWLRAPLRQTSHLNILCSCSVHEC